MKRLAMIVVLSSGIFAGPAMAGSYGSRLLTPENVGGVIGATLGGLAANEVVEGDGQSAATAVGAVAGWLLGKHFAHNYYGGGAYPESGYSTGYPTNYPREYGYTERYPAQPSYSYGAQPQSNYGYGTRNNCCDYDARYEQAIRPIHRTFLATSTSNVRSGPSTQYPVVGQVYGRESVWVIGQVSGLEWYKVQVDGRSGFVYAPLLRPANYAYNGYADNVGLR